MKKIVVINGPNLNLLGTREPEKYGSETLDAINERMTKEASRLGAECEFYQSNSEGELVDAIQRASGTDGIILNAGAYTHYSIALRDAIAAIRAPVVEVHISNVHAREEFRRVSVPVPGCRGVIAGFGADSYILALHALAGMRETDKNPIF
jgi:3-dehydroquinate dehydratase-2